MPTIARLGSMKVNIYFGEHQPPHVHFLYNEYEVILELRSGKVMVGYLPLKQLKRAKNWLEENRIMAQQIFKELNPDI